MSLTIWRISQEKYEQPPFNGEGSRLWGGRWNSKGRNVVYTSENLSLATLETFFHLGVYQINIPRIYLRAEIPDHVAIESINQDSLPSDWQVDPASLSLARIGDEWFDSGRTAILAVPSVLISIEKNYLLNPSHPDFQNIIIDPAQPYEFHQRMLNSVQA